MKRLLFLLFFPILCIAQSENFTIEDNNLVWKKIYNDTISIENFKKQLQNTGKFSKADIIDNQIEFVFNYNIDDLKKYDFNTWSDPTFLRVGGFCNGIIEFKDSKYRVSIFKITHNNIPGVAAETALSEYLIKKGHFKTQKYVNKSLGYLNNIFTDFFTAKYKTDEW